MEDKQQLDPLLDEELGHRARDLAIPNANLDFGLRHGLGKREAFLLPHLRRRRLCLLVDALVLFGDQGLEPLAHDTEDFDIVLEPFGKLLQDGDHAPEQRVRGIDVGGQARRKFAQRIEHLPGRMGFPGKESLVRDGDLEHRNLQPADESFDADGDLRIIE